MDFKELIEECGLEAIINMPDGEKVLVDCGWAGGGRLGEENMATRCVVLA